MNLVQHEGVELIYRARNGLPLPALMALMLTAPLQLDRTRASRNLAGITAAVAVWAFVWLIAPYTTLSPMNATSAGGFPRLNVHAKQFEVAKSIIEHAPPKSMAVVPQEIALWVQSFHDHPYLSYSREVYLKRIAAERSEEEADLRMLMADAVSRAETDTEQRIRKTPGFARRTTDPAIMRRFVLGLETLDVRLVYLNTKGARAGVARRVLKRDFRAVEKVGDSEIWIRAAG